MRRLATLFALVLVWAPSAQAEDPERGTAQEAQAMVARAIALYDQAGMGDAFRQITLSPDPGFRDRDLYLFVIDQAGFMAAHALYPGSVGTNGMNAVDSSGTRYVREIVAHATPEGAWVDYIFIDPLTGAPAPKSTWVVLHDRFIFACGIYAGEVGI